MYFLEKAPGEYLEKNLKNVEMGGKYHQKYNNLKQKSFSKSRYFRLFYAKYKIVGILLKYETKNK